MDLDNQLERYNIDIDIDIYIFYKRWLFGYTCTYSSAWPYTINNVLQFIIIRAIHIILTVIIFIIIIIIFIIIIFIIISSSYFSGNDSSSILVLSVALL